MKEDLSQHDTLIESIPDDLLELWRRGPLLLASGSNFPVVELAGRTVTLRWGSEVIRADVSDCSFRVGRAWQMKRNARKAKRLILFGAHDLILIDFPPLYRAFFTGRMHSYNTAPVGYTKDSLERWKRALKPFIGESSKEPQPPIARFLES